MRLKAPMLLGSFVRELMSIAAIPSSNTGSPHRQGHRNNPYRQKKYSGRRLQTCARVNGVGCPPAVNLARPHVHKTRLVAGKVPL